VDRDRLVEAEAAVSLPYSSFTGQRKPLPPFSEKRLRGMRRRTQVNRIVRERDKVCRLNPRSLFYPHGAETYDLPACGGPLDPHEPKTRGRGGDYLDENEVVLLCRDHHDWCHDHPLEATDLGLLVHSWEPSFAPRSPSISLTDGDGEGLTGSSVSDRGAGS
jgi:hypothetical protein